MNKISNLLSKFGLYGYLMSIVQYDEFVSALYDLIDKEIIGEDEQVKEGNDVWQNTLLNDMRGLQRQQLDKLFGRVTK